jgi:hypothetical protein
MNFFKQILDLQLPEKHCSLTEDKDVIEQRDSAMIWKIKAIVGRITYRMFSKYGKTKFVE